MAELSTAKTLGIIGVVLELIGFLGAGITVFGGALIPIIGAILILIAVKNVSDATGKPEIFRNAVIAFALEITAAVIFIAVVLLAFFTVLPHTIRSLHPSTPGEAVFTILSSLVIAFIPTYILLVIGVFFLKKAYDAIAIEVGVNWFHTAALLYVVGTILAIIVVGVFIVFVGSILELIAWASLPEALPRKTGVIEGEQPSPPSPSPPPTQPM